MKNKMRFLAPALAVVLLLSGCGQAAASPEEASAENPADRAAQIVYGKIKEINGNEIILAIGSMRGAGLSEGGRPSRNEGEAPSFPEGERPSQGEGEAPSFPEGERPSRGEGEMPSRGSGNTGRQGDAASRGQGDRGAPGAGRDSGTAGTQSITLTGEEKTYLIPVTAEITAGQGESGTELRFTQLAVKNVVCLYLDSEGEIFAVQLLQ